MRIGLGMGGGAERLNILSGGLEYPWAPPPKSYILIKS